MRTMFERSFSSGFGTQPIHGFRPMQGLGPVKVLGRLGQFSFDPNEVPSGGDTTTPASPYSFDPNQAPTSPTQSAPVPPAPTTRPPGTSDTDWAKILAEGFKAAGSGYGVYSQAEIAKMKAEADILKAKNPAAASILPGTGLSQTTTILVVLGGIAVVGIGLMVALKP